MSTDRERQWGVGVGAQLQDKAVRDSLFIYQQVSLVRKFYWNHEVLRKMDVIWREKIALWYTPDPEWQIGYIFCLYMYITC